MLRFVVLMCMLAPAPFAFAQAVPPSDPTAISLAIKAVAALSGGNVVNDLTLNVNIISILGSDYESGTAVLRTKGLAESRVDVTLPSGTRTDVRNITNGFPAGAWSLNGAPATPYAQHNCWTDASWFLPLAGALTQSNASGIVFSYIGLEQHNGVNTQHIRVFQAISGFTAVQRLSAMDFYLDPVSFLPLSIDFNMHPDVDMNTNLPAEINFANYRQVSGIQVPFHIQRTLDGTLEVDLQVTSATFNTGLLDSIFTIQ